MSRSGRAGSAGSTVCAAGRHAGIYRFGMTALPQRVLVLGLARSGKAASAALERRGVEVVGADRELGNDDDLALLDGVELLVKSPGVPPESPLVAEAGRRGMPIWSEVELGYRLLRPRLVGVTGTNGKTTTAELLGAMTGAPVAGNVGRALTELDGQVATGALVVCELSSFQLEDVHELACEVAVLLNLEPDHLDRYDSFDAYRAAKLRIFERARAKVVPRGLGLEGVEFGADDPLPAEPRIRGAHNRENAAAATAAARAARDLRGGDSRGAAHVSGSAAPPRAGARAARRPLRERLEGDERRRRAQGARRLRERAPAPDPRRLA